MIRALRSLPWIVLSLLVLASSLSAGWIWDGSAVCTAPYNQTQVRIVPDAMGGAIIVWVDARSGGVADIYAQKVDFAGIPQWGEDGVAICSAAGNQTGPQIIPDTAGGALITWQDARSGNWDIYAQWVNASGTPLWTTNGVCVCAASNTQMVPQIASDGAYGAIIVWQDFRGGTYYDIYGQRVSNLGVVQWAANGVAICAASNSQTAPQLTSDGAGGAIVVWQDYRFGEWDIYAQRVNASGSPLWTSNGVAVNTMEHDQINPTIVSDMSNGAIIAWQDYNEGDANIVGQRLNPSGAHLWMTPLGQYITASWGAQEYPQSISDGAGGAIFVWQDHAPSTYDIRGQRLDPDAIQLWVLDWNGLEICNASGDQTRPQLSSDGAHGAVVTWIDTRNGNEDIYAQRIDASHQLVWGTYELSLCTAAGSQTYPYVATDGAHGAIVAWQDSRLSTSDIYAQRVLSNGLVGTVLPQLAHVDDIPNDQGGKVSVRWIASEYDSPGNIITNYLVWKSIKFPEAAALMRSGAKTVKVSSGLSDVERGSLRMTSLGALGYWWECVGSTPAHFFNRYSMTCPTSYDSMATTTGMHSFFISACTADPFVYYDSAIDSGYSVDNLPPGAPAGLAAVQSYSPAGLALSWNVNLESDLSHYAVYRGTSADFVPGSGNCVATPIDPAWFDGGWSWNSGYYYKVAAVDVHGNASVFALISPDNITGVETPKAPAVTYMRQNYPNPFNPSTRISFGLAAPGNVSLRIYDASGRLVRVLVEGARPAGHYSELWDGRDSRGAAIASGIYFYRLDAGAFSETRKMVMLR